MFFNASLSADLGQPNSFFYSDNNRLIKNLIQIDDYYFSAILDLDEMIYYNEGETFIKKDFDEDLDTAISIYPKNEKIIIGYFSPDFRDHAVAYLSAALYERHNRDQFEIHAFSYGDDTNDEMNQRIKNGVDQFHNINLMTDLDIINLSRSIRVDIAVDLGGYTQNSRTELFAQRVAPIQVNYLGYTGTSGSSYMDYIIADKILIPKIKVRISTVKIVFIIKSF